MKAYKIILVIILVTTSKFGMTQIAPDQKLGHVVLQVKDLSTSQSFYERILGLETKEEAVFEGEKRVFMAASDSHHEIVMKGGLKKDIKKTERHLLQIAFQVGSKKALQEYYRKLKKQKIDVELKDNQISWSIYFNDPDNNQIEVYWDRREAAGRRLWKAEQEVLSAEVLMAE